MEKRENYANITESEELSDHMNPKRMLLLTVIDNK